MKLARVWALLLCLTVCLTAVALAEEEETVTYAVRVFDEDLMPVEGMRFTVADGWDTYTMYTDAEGYASVEVPVSYSYMLRAYPPVGYAVSGQDAWELRPAGENHVLMLEMPELIIPRTIDDLPEPPDDLEPVNGTIEWTDEEHGALVMSIHNWSDGTLDTFSERIGQVEYTFGFYSEENGGEVYWYSVSQASEDAYAKYDGYGHLYYAYAGNLRWSDYFGWVDPAEGPVTLPRDVADVANMKLPVDAKPWPVPANPDPNFPAVPPRELPRIVSAELVEGMDGEMAVITLDKGLYQQYGAFAPSGGRSLSLTLTMEDGSRLSSDELTLVSFPDGDVWECLVPEGTVDVSASLTYDGIFNDRYRSGGDGVWYVTFDEGDLTADWTYAEDGTLSLAIYRGDWEDLFYVFDYEEGTNRLLAVRCPYSLNCYAIFDGEGRIMSATCYDAWKSAVWTPETGWANANGEPIDWQCTTLGDPAALTCPIDLNAPQMEPDWFANAL